MSVVQLRSSQPFDPMDDEHVAAVVRSIANAIEARIAAPRPDIERLVVEQVLRFHDARVTQYIPLLVEKAVLTRLRDQPIKDGGIAR